MLNIDKGLKLLHATRDFLNFPYKYISTYGDGFARESTNHEFMMFHVAKESFACDEEVFQVGDVTVSRVLMSEEEQREVLARAGIDCDDFDLYAP